jgi:hypothetical protein
VKGTATLVPKRLFNEDEKEVYLNGLLAEDVAGEIQTDKVKSLKIRAVYKLTDAVVNVLTARFGKVKFYNIATPFLVGSHTVSQQAGQEQTAFLCVHKDTFQLALHQKDELLFYNNFDYSTASDILYFVLLAYEQYGLDPEIAPLYLSGKVVNDSDIYKVLYRYINHISFLSDPSFIKTGKSTATVNHSFFFPLHSLALC